MSLSDQQMQQIARILIEDHGSALSEAQLTEQIGLLLEDIAGFEAASDDTTSQLIQRIGNAYHDNKNNR